MYNSLVLNIVIVFDDDQSHIFVMIPCWESPFVSFYFNRGKGIIFFTFLTSFFQVFVFTTTDRCESIQANNLSPAGR